MRPAWKCARRAGAGGQVAGEGVRRAGGGGGLESKGWRWLVGSLLGHLKDVALFLALEPVECS